MRILKFKLAKNNARNETRIGIVAEHITSITDCGRGNEQTAIYMTSGDHYIVDEPLHEVLSMLYGHTGGIWG